MSNESGWLKSIFEIPTNSGFQAEAPIFGFLKAFLDWGRVGRSSATLGQDEAQTRGTEWSMPWGKIPWDREMRVEKAQDAAGSFRLWQVWRGLMGRGTDFDPFPGTSSVGRGFECGSLGEGIHTRRPK